MSADLPHTLYKRKGVDKKVRQEDVDDATSKMMEAYERKMKAREDQATRDEENIGLTVEEIFGGAMESE